MPQVTATFTWDTDQISAWLSGHQKQLPFAQKQAINEVAFALKKTHLPAEAKRVFDRPTRFTSTSATWRVKKATKQIPEALVFPEAKREPYLRANITGGQRGVKRVEAAFGGVATAPPPADQFFPTSLAKRNQYGNVSRAALRKILDSAKSGDTERLSYFVGKPRNSSKPYGVYRRMARRLRPVFLPATSAMNYSSVYDIGQVADDYIKSEYQQIFERHFARAIKTAR